MLTFITCPALTAITTIAVFAMGILYHDGVPATTNPSMAALGPFERLQMAITQANGFPPNATAFLAAKIGVPETKYETIVGRTMPADAYNLCGEWSRCRNAFAAGNLVESPEDVLPPPIAASDPHHHTTMGSAAWTAALLGSGVLIGVVITLMVVTVRARIRELEKENKKLKDERKALIELMKKKPEYWKDLAAKRRAQAGT